MPAHTVYDAYKRTSVKSSEHMVTTITGDGRTYRSVYVRTFHARVSEIRAKGISIEERKLTFHVATIALSMALTIIGTLALFALWHIGLVLPAFPSLIQEVWDWMFKQ